MIPHCFTDMLTTSTTEISAPESFTGELNNLLILALFKVLSTILLFHIFALVMSKLKYS